MIGLVLYRCESVYCNATMDARLQAMSDRGDRSAAMYITCSVGWPFVRVFGFLGFRVPRTLKRGSRVLGFSFT